MQIKKVAFFLTLILTLTASYFSTAQSKNFEKDILKIRQLFDKNDLKNALEFTQQKINNHKINNTEDSLEIARFYSFSYSISKKLKFDENKFLWINKAIQYCPITHKGDSLKATMYNTKAYDESNLGDNLNSYRSITKSLELLEKIPNPNPGFLMGGYLLLSNKQAYFGNFEKAKSFMRLAEKTYSRNKKYIDDNTYKINGNNHRLGVIAKYRKINMLAGFFNKEDSLAIINTMNALEKMHSAPDFHREEQIYYSTALNHIGDWYVSRKHDSLITAKDVSYGLQYLLKALDFVENKKYTGTPWAIKYNIAKAYTRGNQVKKADSTIAELFNLVSKTDGRLPFFNALKGQIKAKKQQKDSALFFFNKSIEFIHNDEKPLQPNFENFTPSNSYNHTKLLLRIAEELNRFYPKDTIVQKKVTRLHLMALQQFKNSYLSTSFNKKQNHQLRKIIQGLLKNRNTGYIKLNQKNILNQFEILKNQLSWKKFYESRFTNTLPALDTIKDREIQLASLLKKASITFDIASKDSINLLIDQLTKHKKKLFPQLELLTNLQFSIDDLQKKLTPDDVILKYVILENKLAIYQISKDNFKVTTLKFTNKKKTQLTEFITSTKNRNFNSDLAKQINTLLIPEFHKEFKNLIINPDGILFKLPFEILISNNDFLISKYKISYTSNLGFIKYLKPKIASKKDVHIYAPQYQKSSENLAIRNKATFLEGANKEAKTISKILPSVLFNGEDLNKTKFINTAPKAKILHLAMHGDINDEVPELSRLLFSNNLKNDNQHLYIEELYGLSLNADLAILSACNSGVGLEKNGTLESFQRAFTFAGVTTTVASLWEVPDAATEQIMVFFYQNLKAGQSKSEALRNAKLSYKTKYANSKLSAPYFWAGFVVYGNDSPIKVNSFSYYLLFFGVLLLVIIFFFFKKNK